VANFRTRARAVDMLGRQQIAGIPTAISELFKNAHDAYADRVEVDFYRNERLFVLRDDGVGMTREEFENRWLTLGTESKVGINESPNSLVPPNKTRRTMLGEKGIGRLAIAAIGSQVLILTRAERDGVVQPLVAAYIHWGVFECPGLNLDEIEIPIREFVGGELPTAGDVREMVEAFRSNLDRHANKFPPVLKERIEEDSEAFLVAPDDIDSYLKTPELSLRNGGCGTHFILSPCSDLLATDIDGDNSNSGVAPPLTKVLLGFTETMTPNHSAPVIQPAFRDWQSDIRCEELISERDFFTPDDFITADHRIAGEFDEYGQFCGSVWVFGKEFPQHVIPWRGAKGQKTKCGSFSIDVAVAPGMDVQSQSDPAKLTELRSKLDKIGGLYIHRNGIRILPYGGPDFDWLDLELMRTKSAAYYFFSYRRLFGVTKLDSTNNSGLKEKAGREGFSENRAYRDLKSILKNFFLQLAADYFRDTATRSDHFATTRNELKRLDEARKKREAQTGVKRQHLELVLADFFVEFDNGKPLEATQAVVADIESQIEVARNTKDPKIAAQAFLRIESEARSRLSELRESHRITRPRGIGLSKKTESEWAKYSDAYATLVRDVYSPAEQRLNALVGSEAARARVELDRRLRIEVALDELAAGSRKTARKESNETRGALEKVEHEVRDAAGKSIANVERVVSEVMRDFGKEDVSLLNDELLVDLRSNLENRIIEVQEKERDFLQYLRAQLETIDVAPGGGQLDQMEALEQSNLALNEQADLDMQLTQLGMAIEIINHEFNGNVRSIRNNLREFKAWADLNPKLGELYQNIRASFDHLDGYLTLFTPLHRRLYRQEIDISGEDIRKFLGDLFDPRFKRHDVKITSTVAFQKHRFKGFPSSFYPVFVNLTDNAIFWLHDFSGPREIRLDYRDGAMIMEDSGPGIPVRDSDDVFSAGFTRKPGGRGLGLYISREALQKVGYQINLLAPNDVWKTIFSIKPH